jgi:hypothetical protein
VTGPEVLISGGDHDGAAPPRLPTWLRRAIPVLVVAVGLSALGVRLLHDQHRHTAAAQAADQVEAVVKIDDAGVGIGGSVLVGIQVSGRGAKLTVGRPRVRPASLMTSRITGVPFTVSAGEGNAISVRLQPDCDRVAELTTVAFEVPVAPKSGKQRLLRLPFPRGPDLLRRACGYLPVDEALTTSAHSAIVKGPGERLSVEVLLRNDGRDLLTVTGVSAAGLAVTAQLPVVVRPREPSVPLPLVLRVPDCGLAPRDLQASNALRVQVADGEGRVSEVVLSIEERVTTAYRAYRQKRCP